MTKLTFMCVLFFAFMASTSALSKEGSIPCSSGQYWNGSSCKRCPPNANCNGEWAICNPGFTDMSKDFRVPKCVKMQTKCKSNQYLLGKNCAPCPQNATCDGEAVTCKKGTTATLQNGKIICQAKQCTQTSQHSAHWVKKHYKNCKNCKEELRENPHKRNKKEKYYSCTCDC